MIVSLLQLMGFGLASAAPAQPGKNPESAPTALDKGGVTRMNQGPAASGQGPTGVEESQPVTRAARRPDVSTPKKKTAAAPAAAKKTTRTAASKKAAPAPVAKPVAKAAAKSSAGPASSKKPAAKTSASAVAKPVAKAPAPSVAKPAAKPAAKTAAKTAAKPAAKVAAVKPAAAAKPAVAAKVTAPMQPAPAPAKPAPAPARAVLSPIPARTPARPRSGKAESLIPPPPAPAVASTAAKASYLNTMSAPVLVPPPHVTAKKDPKLANNWKTKPVAQLTDADVLAMPDSEYMNDAQMAFFRLKLTQLKQDILNNAGETTEHLREDTVIVPDPADRATIEEEHALELRTRDRERKLLKKIEQSIGRIDAGDYGYCDETGEPIGVGRLLARPTATLSLEAQQRRELKQKMFGD